jgi:23S rRNA (pseudouridine1915-N3)-methyltransferase
MIKIICVGKAREHYFKDAINEYLKRLSKYTKIRIVELEDDAGDDEVRVLIGEKERILKNIKPNDYVITLEIEGLSLDSISFSKKIEDLLIYGKSNITFVIGGSYGLHNDVKDKADLRLSFSKLTFPHQMFRVILLEQIYRAFKIINNEIYHK